MIKPPLVIFIKCYRSSAAPGTELSPVHPAGKKIRHCFFRAHQAKMVNCVPASAAAQHIEAPIITNNNLPDG